MKKKWILPLIVGVLIVAVGIALVVSGARIEIPPELEMGEPGWIESSHAAFSQNSKKIALIVFGVFIIIFGIMLALFIYFSSKQIGFIKSRMHAFNDGIKNAFNGAVNSKKKKKIYCEYCGTKLSENDRKCPGCGCMVTKGSDKPN